MSKPIVKVSYLVLLKLLIIEAIKLESVPPDKKHPNLASDINLVSTVFSKVVLIKFGEIFLFSKEWISSLIENHFFNIIDF